MGHTGEPPAVCGTGASKLSSCEHSFRPQGNGAFPFSLRAIHFKKRSHMCGPKDVSSSVILCVFSSKEWRHKGAFRIPFPPFFFLLTPHIIVCRISKYFLGWAVWGSFSGSLCRPVFFQTLTYFEQTIWQSRAHDCINAPKFFPFYFSRVYKNVFLWGLTSFFYCF